VGIRDAIERSAPPPVGLVVMVRSELVRLGVTRLLQDAGLRVAGEAGDIRAGLTVLRDVDADVVVVEATPSAAGLDALRAFVRSVPQRVVVLVRPEDDGAVLEALAAGARGCVAADAPPEEIVTAVRAAAAGERHVSTGLAHRLSRSLGLGVRRASPPAPELTGREREVLELMSQGLDNAQIARELYLSTATVKHHTASIFAKLRVANRVQAAVRAVREGLLDGPA
jgi:DNA-binding NarL/FixJ family response regulator